MHFYIGISFLFSANLKLGISTGRYAVRKQDCLLIDEDEILQDLTDGTEVFILKSLDGKLSMSVLYTLMYNTAYLNAIHHLTQIFKIVIRLGLYY